MRRCPRRGERQRIVEGKVTADEFVDLRRARTKTLAEACPWMLDGRLYGNIPDAKNGAAKLWYWKRSTFAIADTGVRGSAPVATVPVSK